MTFHSDYLRLWSSAVKSYHIMVTIKVIHHYHHSVVFESPKCEHLLLHLSQQLEHGKLTFQCQDNIVYWLFRQCKQYDINWYIKVPNIDYLNLNLVVESCLILNNTSLLEAATTAIYEANSALDHFNLEIQITKTFLESEVWGRSNLGQFINAL